MSNSKYFSFQLRPTVLFVLITTLAIFSYSQSFAQELPPRPNPPKLVNDMADMLMPSQVDALEQKLDAYNDSTSTQITVVTMHSTGQYAIADYAVKLGRAWGIGGKKFNNGVLLLVAADDHKAFIATGYGMEGPLPDATCNEIIDNDIIPNFKQQNYYAGINEAANDMIAAAAGEYQAPPHKQEKGGGGLGFFIGLIVLIIIIASIGSGGRGGRGGGRRRGGWIGPMLLGGMLGSTLGDGGRGGGWSGGSGGFGGGGGFGGFGGGSW